MRIVLLLLLIGIVIIIPSVYAVDFKDSTGYTPSWAKPLGYHEALSRCSGITGDATKDGNWCFEWVAYVLDQGIENFPESATGKNQDLSDFSQIQNREYEFGLVEGQWVEYQINFQSLSDKSMESTIDRLKSQFNFGTFTVEEAEQINFSKLTVEKVDENEVTTKGIFKMKNGDEIIREPKTIKFEKIIDTLGIAIPINVELGDAFDTAKGFSPLRVVGIENFEDNKNKNVETYILQSNTEIKQNNLTFFFEIRSVHEKSTGILLEFISSIQVYDDNTNDFGSLVLSKSATDFSTQGMKIVETIPDKPSKYEIFKKLSPLLVKDWDGRYWITNERTSGTGDSMVTSYDILKVKDHYKIGELVISGNNNVSSVYAESHYDYSDRSSPTWTSVDTASDILHIIRDELTDCFGCVDNHYITWSENDGGGEYFWNKKIGNIELEMGMNAYKYDGKGTFTQKIRYPLSTESLSGEKRFSEEVSEINPLTDTNEVSQQSKISEPTDYDAGFTALAVFIVIGIPSIIIGIVIWKIKKYLAKRRERKLQKM